MRQHHSLGEARRTRCILHIAYIMAVHLTLHLVEFLVLDVLSQQQQLCGIIHTTVFLHANEHHILHIRETLTVQMATLATLQFRQHRIGHIDIVAIPCTISDTEGMHVGVLTEIFQLVLFIVGVHRNQHSTNLGGRIKEGKPIGHIRCPDTHIRSFLHANGDQTFGQVIHTLVELTPCET